MGDKPNASNDTTAILGAGLLVVTLALHESLSVFMKWIINPSHQLIFILALTPILTAVLYWFSRYRESKISEKQKMASIIGEVHGSVYCGQTQDREAVFIKPRQRSMHTQVIGTTNAGKTESVILPWAIQDLEQGRGLILIDGKSDRGLLNKLWNYSVKYGRENDFRLFSLGSIDESHQFNPLIGGSPEEISERVFNSFEFENEYFRSVQFEVFSQVLRIFADAHEIPTFLKLHQAITEPNRLVALSHRLKDDSLRQWADHFKAIPASDRLQRTSGLTAALSQFAFGKTAQLFNTEKPSFTLETALNDNLIIYFQLPVLLSPFLGRASGKMILQCLQSAVANRHRGENRSPQFFSVFLDDFTEYLYPGFVSVLNKSRSANVGIVFAHQALGDIQTLGDAIANSILTNANLKVFMRGNDPDSAEYFAKVVGTTKGEKFTSRTRKTFWANESTGDGSVREVEQFIVHPNKFKNELGVGQAVMVIPHEGGSKTIDIQFEKFDDLDNLKLIEPIKKSIATGLPVPTAEVATQRIVK
ncbi:MAG: type IV secretory system conjugative DNA transfer family protein [Bdellovibrionales bacterium]|nr:type IV secretory system conjugative DNA transfer family protein [Bdellovibrionales bacterium]